MLSRARERVTTKMSAASAAVANHFGFGTAAAAAGGAGAGGAGSNAGVARRPGPLARPNSHRNVANGCAGAGEHARRARSKNGGGRIQQYSSLAAEAGGSPAPWLTSGNSTLQAMNNATDSLLAAAEDPPGPPTLLRFDSRCVVVSQLNKKWKRPAVAGRGFMST